MRARHAVRGLLSSAVFIAWTTGTYCAKLPKKDAPPVELCDLLSTPSKYAGRTLTVVTRITSTKEGGFLWDPGCAKLGVRFIFGGESVSVPGMVELSRELRTYGLSDYPVIATLKGVYLPDYYDQVLQRHYRAFKITSATSIRRSRRAERP